MNYKLQEVACFFLRLTGLPWFLREVYARHKVTIINYHNPREEICSKHLQYFDKHYSFISIDERGVGELIQIASEREKMELTEKQLAKLLGCSKQELLDVENIDLKTLLKLAEIFKKKLQIKFL